MVQIGRKIYYNNITGEVIADIAERSGSVMETTFEEDCKIYKALSEINIDIIGAIQLEYGQYLEDFASCSGYKVDVETKELVFSYDGGTEEEPPVFQKPLTEQVRELKEQTSSQEQAIAELTLIVTMNMA